jgi:hypothetical protein
MKSVFLVLSAAMLTACATQTAETNPAQDRYEAYYGASVISNAVRDLACGSHHYSIGDNDAYSKCGDYGSSILEGLSLVRTPAGDKALAQTFALGMDAHFSELRMCVALVRGKALLPALRALDLDPKGAYRECDRALLQAMEEFPKADPGRVCNSVEKIRWLIKDIAGQITLGKKCEPWNSD